MGFMTLSDFRDSVRHAAGGKGIGRAKIDRWINQGYYEVFARVYSFRGSLTQAPQDTAVSTSSYLLPARTRAIYSVVDPANKRRLIQETLENLLRRSREPTDKPRFYASSGASVHLRPIPDAVYSLELWLWQEPAPLVAGSDLSVFESDLDVAIESFAKFYALQSMGYDMQARVWFQRAREIIDARISDYGREFQGADMLGVQIAQGFEDIEDFQ